MRILKLAGCVSLLWAILVAFPTVSRASAYLLTLDDCTNGCGPQAAVGPTTQALPLSSPLRVPWTPLPIADPPLSAPLTAPWSPLPLPVSDPPESFAVDILSSNGNRGAIDASISAPVPEPSVLVLVATALLGIGYTARKRILFRRTT